MTEVFVPDWIDRRTAEWCAEICDAIETRIPIYAIAEAAGGPRLRRRDPRRHHGRQTGVAGAHRTGEQLMSDADANAILAIADKIKPLLAGNSPEVQGAVLAELTAIWLAGHRVPGDPRAQQSLRAELLAMHIEAVTDLVDPNDQEINQRLRAH